MCVCVSVRERQRERERKVELSLASREVTRENLRWPIACTTCDHLLVAKYSAPVPPVFLCIREYQQHFETSAASVCNFLIAARSSSSSRTACPRDTTLYFVARMYVDAWLLLTVTRLDVTNGTSQDRSSL